MNKELIAKIDNIIDSSLPYISNLSNISAILNTISNINWVGFYLTHENELILGPFQGEVACSRIKFNKGVCGTAAYLKKTLIVDDVDKFKGHIRCSSASKSEIVTPLIKNNQVIGVIDIDSSILSRFDKIDQEILEEIAKIIVSKVF